MERREDEALRRLALEELDRLLDESREFPTRAQLRNLALPVATPHLVDLQKGIWNPSWLLATLSVVTVLNGPYPDVELGDGLWEYRYRAGGSEGDNRKLQRAADLDVDLIYFREATPGRYLAEYPVRVVQNDPVGQKVLLARKDLDRINWHAAGSTVSESLRSWATREVKQRVHQRRFREQVIAAYDTRCAICELPIRTLLDAAHIDADSSVDGEPVIPNGIALCKLHHYAYDANIVGLSPSRRIHISERVLALRPEGMTLNGLQAFHRRKLGVPAIAAQAPGEERLARRWHEFRKSGA